MDAFATFRSSLTHWRDRAALDFYRHSVERGTYDAESIEAMADLIVQDPDEARRQLRSLMPCPCVDRDWFEHGDTSSAGLRLGRAVGLIQAADEPCIDPYHAPRSGHAAGCRQRAHTVIVQVALEITPVIPTAGPRDWMAEAKAIDAGAAIAPRTEHIRELLALLELRSETVRQLTRRAA